MAKLLIPNEELAQVPLDQVQLPLIDPATGKPREKRYVTQARAEKYWIEKARTDPAFFIHYVTGREPAKHHRLWLQNIFDYTDKGRADKKYRLNFIAPRESAKTTIVMWAFAWFVSRFPWTTNMIISVSAAQAEKRLEMVRDLIAHDQRYKNVFPWIEIDKVQRDTIQEFSLNARALYDHQKQTVNTINYNVWRSLIKRIGSPKDPTLFVTGSGGKGIIGRRISGMMILDDIIDENFLKSSLQEEVHDYIMRTLIPCVQEEAKVINIGTRWMPDDIPQKLKENPEWKTVEIQALRYDENGTPYSYWPEFWPVDKLERKRAEINNDVLFRVMYLNDPTALTHAQFSIEGLSQKLPEVLPKLTQIIVGTDFAISTKARADWTVFSAVGLDEARNIYILDMRRIKAMPDVVCAELNQFCNDVALKYGKVDHVLIEKVAFQTAMKFILAEKYPQMPIEAVPPVGDKGHRLGVFSTKSNEFKVYYNTKCEPYNQLRKEALNFSGQANSQDDCLDSITIAVQYMGSSIHSVNVRRLRSPYLI